MYNGNNFYQAPTRQDNINMIDEQIARLNQMRNQITQQPNVQTPQPTSINQTFQLAPTTHSTMRFVNTMEDVAKEVVFADTPYFSKDMSVLWVKNNKGEIKTYELNEIIPKDDKDIKIEFLTAKLEELERKMKDESNVIVDEPVTNANESEEPPVVSTISKSSKKSK